MLGLGLGFNFSIKIKFNKILVLISKLPPDWTDTALWYPILIYLLSLSVFYATGTWSYHHFSLLWDENTCWSSEHVKRGQIGDEMISISKMLKMHATCAQFRHSSTASSSPLLHPRPAYSSIPHLTPSSSPPSSISPFSAWYFRCLVSVLTMIIKEKVVKNKDLFSLGNWKEAIFRCWPG